MVFGSIDLEAIIEPAQRVYRVKTFHTNGSIKKRTYVVAITPRVVSINDEDLEKWSELTLWTSIMNSLCRPVGVELLIGWKGDAKIASASSVPLIEIWEFL